MRRQLATILLSSIIALPAACGTSEEKVTPVGPSINELVQAFCDTAFRCCTHGEVAFFLGPYLTELNCSERLTRSSELAPSMLFPLIQLRGLALSVPNVGALDRAAQEKRGSIDSKAVAACLEYLADLECNEYVEEEKGCKPPPPPPTDTPCDPRKLFVGNLEAGEACTSGTASLECKPGLLCRTAVGQLGVKGECVRPGALSDPCFTDDECGEGLYCSQLDGTCQHLRKEGETCVYSDRESATPSTETLLLACEPHLSCDPIADICVSYCQQGAACTGDDDEQCDAEQDLFCISGRCDKLRIEGQPCSLDNDCVEGLVCILDRSDPEGRLTCQPRLPLGESCTLHTDCESGFCDPDEYRCASPVPAGTLCPSGMNEQCIRGACVTTPVLCTSNEQCTGSGACDLTTNYCMPYCAERKPDGATCAADAECVSEECAAGFCRTLPLTRGQACDTHEQCESEFCGLEDERVCTELPLPLGAACSDPSQCDSLVCFDANVSDLEGPECTSGLDEGEPCGDSDQPPCDPKRFYCDTERDEPVCVKLREAGEDCKGSYQCRGACVANFGRMMCDTTPAPERAVCDGAGTPGREDD